MKLYTFEHSGQAKVGKEVNGQLVDVTTIAPTMLALVQGGEATLKAVRDAQGSTYALDSVRVHAPIRPGKILCSGVNYRGHGEENPNAKLPESPFFFSKVPSAVIGPNDPIICPKISQQVDYEVEFAVVIGRAINAKTPESSIMSHIFGYTILHDVSARDVQFKDNQITLGKNFDSFAPVGPCIVTADEIPDPASVKLRTTLNGEVMQDDSNRDWLFPLPKLIGALAQVMTLEPGDIVTTGTPAGVGYFKQPQVFLKPGDQVALEIEGIGRLENPVIAAS